jgi:hypothetical protein
MLAFIVYMALTRGESHLPDVSDVKFLVLEGGGVKGIANGGVFQVRTRSPARHDGRA